MSEKPNEYLPAIASISSRLDILENFYNEASHLIAHAQEGIEKCFERMEKLEEAYKADAQVARDIIFEGARRNDEIRQIKSDCDSHCGAILELERWKKAAIEKNIQDVVRLRELENIQAETRLCRLESDRLGEQLDQKVWKFLTEKVDGLETEINVVRALGSRAFHPKKPHKCPVCEGKGIISTPDTIRFDIVIAQSEKIGWSACHACEGKGVLWG